MARPSLSHLADLESAKGPGFGMRLSGQNDVLHIVPVFFPENVTSFLPKPFAARRSKQIHGEQFPAVPKPRRQRLFAPLVEGILRKRDKCHESLNELRFLYFI